MVTITVLGLDQYIVGRLSRELTPNLAKIYEMEEEDIVFISPNNMVFHKGTEQTSWHTIVKVNAPKKVAVLEEEVDKIIANAFKEITINLVVEFLYYAQDSRHVHLNEEYPRFLSEENLVDVDYEEDYDPEEVFDGDIFDGVL